MMGGGGRRVGGGGQGRCEQRSEVCVEIQLFYLFFFGGGSGQRGVPRLDVNKELKFL